MRYTIRLLAEFAHAQTKIKVLMKCRVWRGGGMGNRIFATNIGHVQTHSQCARFAIRVYATPPPPPSTPMQMVPAIV